jgi:hypothetical protein
MLWRAGGSGYRVCGKVELSSLTICTTSVDVLIDGVQVREVVLSIWLPRDCEGFDLFR